MTKVTLNEAFFEKNLPEPTAAFEEKTMAMLRMKAAQQRQAEAGIRPKRTRMALVIALILTLLMATALAVGLRLSARYTAVRNGKEALMAKYSLTKDTLWLFGQTVTEEDGTLTITYTPGKFDTEAMGVYTAVVEQGKEPVVSWTHDDYLPGSGFAPWGQDMLEKALAVERTHSQDMAKNDEVDKSVWTLEDLAERDRALATAAEMGLQPYVWHVVPRAEDIQEENAVEMAMEILIERYGVTRDDFQGLNVDLSLLQYSEQDEPVYVFNFYGEEQGFNLRMYTPSGKVESSNWMTLPESRTLPEGDLTGYRKAVEDYVKSGAFDMLTPDKKAELAKRITDAGYGDAINHQAFIMPTEDDISEEEARTRAREALAVTYRMEETGFTFFQETASLLLEDDRRVWEIRRSPMENEWREFSFESSERLGEYTVTLAADTGELLSVKWSNDAIAPEEVTQSTWGPVYAVPAYALPWARDFQNARLEIGLEYPDGMQAVLEREAAIGALYRSVGYPQEQYASTLPSADDIKMDDAVKIAVEALQQEYGLGREVTDTADITPYFDVREPGKSIWGFSFFLPDPGNVVYTVMMDGKTGELFSVELDGGGNG